MAEHEGGEVGHRIEKLFGRSWRTTLGALIAGAAGLVIVIGPHVGAPAVVLEVAKFLALGGVVGGGLAAKDRQVSGLPRR